MEDPQLPHALDREFLRFSFCSIIIAAFLAGLVAGPDLRTLINPGATSIALIVLGLSAAFAFAYVLAVASHLKYQAPGRIDRYPLPHIAGQFLYDASINIFGFYFIVLIAQIIATHIFHSHTITSLILTIIFGSGLIYLVTLPIWLLVIRVISRIYARRSRVSNEAVKRP